MSAQVKKPETLAGPISDSQSPVGLLPPARYSCVTDGQSPIDLQSPISLLKIDDGKVNIFIELADKDGNPTGRRKFVTSVHEGEYLPIPPEPAEHSRLLAVGVGQAEVTLISAHERDKELVTIGLDRPFKEFLHHVGHSSAPSSAMSVKPGMHETLDNNRTLTSQQLAWVEISEVTGQCSLENGQYPVTSARTIHVPAGTTITVRSTSDVIADFGWEVMDHWSEVILAEAGRNFQEDIERDRQHIARRRKSDQAMVSDAHESLAAILNRPDSTGTSDSKRKLGSIAYAITAVCENSNIAVPAEFAATESETDSADAAANLRYILAQANLRVRRISLEGQWERQDGASFIGFDAESGRPVAVLRKGPSRFEIVDQETGGRRRVDAGIRDHLTNEGYVIYRPLPYRVINGWDLLRHVWESPARVDLKWAVGLAFVVSMLGLLTPVLAGSLLNDIIPYGERYRLMVFAGGLVVLTIGSSLFQLVRSIALLRVNTLADSGLQAAVMDRLLELPLQFFQRYQVGELLKKTMAPTELRQVLSGAAFGALLGAVFSIVNFCLMFFYNAKLAVAALLFTIIAGTILLVLSFMQLRHEKEQLKAEGQVYNFILQVIFGIQKIRLSGAEDRAYALWLERFSEHRLISNRAAKLSNVTSVISGALPLLASIMFFAIIGMDNGTIAVGTFIAFNMAFGQFFSAMLSLVGLVSTSLSAIAIYDNMKPLLEETPEINPNRLAPGALTGDIQLRNINFGYDEDGPLVLDDVNIDIAPGEFIALVGPSGAGKSSIFRLLLGFERPRSGVISFDNKDQESLDLKAMRRQFGVVLQNGTLFPGSIFENIVGASSLTREEAWEAARMAGFDEDIKQMPMGMHTVLSEGGGGLSGGQRQRLMIARAIVRKPRIMLMDEATSAIDNRTQAIVSESLERLNATRIVIAHRLSTVVHADRIYVLDKGRVVQSGTYDDLIKVPGLFQEIARPQLG